MMGAVRRGAALMRARPELMTARARVYLLSTVLTHVPLALLCLVAPQTFRSPSYEVILEGAPLWLSGLMFGASSVVCAVAALQSSAQLARIGLGLSFVISGTWTIGLVGTIVIGNPSGYTAPLVWLALTIKDGLQCMQPQRLPLEPVIRDVLQDGEPSTDTQRR